MSVQNYPSRLQTTLTYMTVDTFTELVKVCTSFKDLLP